VAQPLGLIVTSRSRFLELHVDDIPDGELATILHRRCDVAPSYAAKMVATMRELQRQRQVRPAPACHRESGLQEHPAAEH